jgi:hypothetical protein
LCNAISTVIAAAYCEWIAVPSKKTVKFEKYTPGCGEDCLAGGRTGGTVPSRPIADVSANATGVVPNRIGHHGSPHRSMIPVGGARLIW